ncbi:uncharacterized protein LOC106672726 isoform X1 [Cimex lectularius]|uniref:Uncharacterized protein n=2 Tax=Cimex lectularius TaxID=79782 RepID=A0A8I6SB02_CIMLE|nr:uncharacterized protein LOC106672726 isoform X1 [Cimex lectularius]XP_014259859.1 uncharacterized protein LOC106672726 isoform X1 [Cimex lectularius]
MKSRLYNGVSKMTRTELEGAYCEIVNENLILKRTVQNQSKEIKRLEILFGNANTNHKDRYSATPTLEDIRFKDIQARNKYLMDKVSVLTHQLLQQSRFHAQAHKCLKKSPSKACYKKNPPSEGIENERIDHQESEKEETIHSISENSETEDDSTSRDVSSYSSIASDRSGLTNTFDHLMNNVDNLRWKIFLRQNNEEKEMLVATAEGEINALRKTIQMLNEDYDDICAQLNEAHIKCSELQTELLELNSLKKSYKMLEEKLKDIKEEREMLREVNNKLLALNDNGEENLSPNVKGSIEVDYSAVIE